TAVPGVLRPGEQSLLLGERAGSDRSPPHIGIGRIATHKVHIKVPPCATLHFDTTVQPFQAIDDRIVLCRFTTSRPAYRSEFYGSDFRGVGIEPEIRAWAGFNINGAQQSLQDRMV